MLSMRVVQKRVWMGDLVAEVIFVARVKIPYKIIEQQLVSLHCQVYYDEWPSAWRQKIDKTVKHLR